MQQEHLVLRSARSARLEGHAARASRWAKRGPTGTVPLSRAESHAVAQRLLAEVPPGGKSGAAGLRALLVQRGVAVVDCAGWRRIDAAEKARAVALRARDKFATTAELLRASQPM